MNYKKIKLNIKKPLTRGALRCVGLTFVKQKKLGYQPFFILNK